MWVDCVDRWILDLVDDHIALHAGVSPRVCDGQGEEPAHEGERAHWEEGARWCAPSDALTALMDEVTEPFGLERGRMLGGPAYFVGGNVVGLVYGDSIVLRATLSDRAAIKREAMIPFEPVPGLIMREYTVVPSFAYGDTAELSEWMAEAVECTRLLPARSIATRT